MEKITYRLTIPMEEFTSEIDMVMRERINFKAAHPGVSGVPDVRINSVGYEEISRDEIEIVFDITIEYEI